MARSRAGIPERRTRSITSRSARGQSGGRSRNGTFTSFKRFSSRKSTEEKARLKVAGFSSFFLSILSAAATPVRRAGIFPG